MALVFRLEDAEGNGVYSWSNVIKAEPARKIYDEFGDDMYTNPGRNPSPSNDKYLSRVWDKLADQDSWRFGFSSIDQLRKWFYRAEWRLYLQRLGVVLGIYEVPEEFYRGGDKQVIFRPEHARKVDTLYAY